MAELNRKTIYVGNSYQGHARHVPIILDAVQVRQDIDNNRSFVRATLRKEQVYDSNYAFSNTSSSNLQGNHQNHGKMYFTTSTIQTKEITVEHDAEGNGYVDISASLNTAWGNVNLSGRFNCTKIPRASSLVATDAYIESASILSIQRASSSFRHTITYEFLGLTGTITNKTAETTVGFTIPTSFYEKIPNAKSGKCKFYITTYSGNNKIGETKSCEITVTCAEDKCKPLINGSVVDSNAATIALTGSADNLIKFFSNALCNITATAKNGSTISSKKISCSDGKSINNSGTIEKVEAGDFTFTIIDSRGFSNSVEINKTIVDYINLTANLEIVRPVATQNKIQFKFNGNYYKGSFGSVANQITAKYRYRNKTDNGQFSQWINLPISISTTNNTYSISYESPEVFNYDKLFEIEYEIKDKLITINKTANVKKGLTIFDWGKDDFNFNVAVNIKGNLSIGNIKKISGCVSTGSTHKYLKLGSWRTPGNGNKLKIETVFSAGYNAVNNQIVMSTLILNTSNGIPNESNGYFAGIATLDNEKSNSEGMHFFITNNNDTCDVWFKATSYCTIMFDVTTCREGDFTLSSEIRDISNPPTGTYSNAIYPKNYKYPIGSYYQSNSSANPSALFGGTWVQITGRFLYATTNTNLGGSNTHTLTTAEMPAHAHAQQTIGSDGNVNPWVSSTNWGAHGVETRQQYTYRPGTGKNVTTLGTGSGNAHNNMPAYKGVYTWYRSA